MAKEQIVALCADDYGLSYAVSAGILEALDAGRITAVSALVNGPRWPAMGLELVRRGRDADIGLHLNLTLGRPLSSMPKFAPNGEFPPLSQVVRMAYGGRLPMDEIRVEIDRQFDRFEAVTDRPPDHVDGHQHIHVLPGIRTALLDAMATRRLGGRVWVRDAGDGVHRILARGANARKALSALSLASGFRREARRRGFSVNDGFAGFSDFHPSFDYAKNLSKLSSSAWPQTPHHVPSRPCGRRPAKARSGDDHPRAGTCVPSVAEAAGNAGAARPPAGPTVAGGQKAVRAAGGRGSVDPLEGDRRPFLAVLEIDVLQERRPPAVEVLKPPAVAQRIEDRRVGATKYGG